MRKLGHHVGLVLAVAVLLSAVAEAEPSERWTVREGATVQQAQTGPTRKRREIEKRREEERRQKAEEASKRREAEARRAVEVKRRAEEEKRRKAEDARRRREAEARRKAEGESRRRAAIRRAGKDCAQCPAMVVIPGGSFLMGSKVGDPDEKPVHRVTVRRFAMGKYEVTFANWDACVAEGGCSQRPGDGGWGRGRRPVINVSWNDAKQYVAWLIRKTGKRYRLPSEAEWEYAARAGTKTKYWWGEDQDAGCRFANGVDLMAKAKFPNLTVMNCRDGYAETAPVGSFRPNRFGLYDMIGNVWEWVEDCWHDSYAGAPANGRPWTSGGDCSNRVLRGGSWYIEPRYFRSANRIRGGTGNRDFDSGFRVARTLP